ncbi:MAG: SDR family oxidoreductase [Methylobacterium mesophilicum]|nr:SDR family oxidoreductase [Methylobacterium mesophilicum]
MPSARFPDLDGASVLVTGGGSGIGAGIVEAFARQGARVAFFDIAEEPSRELCRRLEAEGLPAPLFVAVDLRDVEALRAAVAQAAEAHGPVTVLVNNAALDDRHRIEDVTPRYWDDNQNINLRPHFFTAQAVAPGMKAAGGGSIVNITSTSWLINHPDMPSYTAAKAGIVGLSKGLAGELGRDNIRVNAVAPGWVLTERQKALWVTEERVAAHVARQSIKRAMAVEDIVGTVLFLASDASRMLSAQLLIVDGGYL